MRHTKYKVFNNNPYVIVASPSPWTDWDLYDLVLKNAQKNKNRGSHREKQTAVKAKHSFLGLNFVPSSGCSSVAGLRANTVAEGRN